MQTSIISSVFVLSWRWDLSQSKTKWWRIDKSIRFPDMIILRNFMCSNASFYRTKQRLWNFCAQCYLGGLWFTVGPSFSAPNGGDSCPSWQFSWDTSALLIALNLGVPAGVASSDILSPPLLSASGCSQCCSARLNPVRVPPRQMKYMLLTFCRFLKAVFPSLFLK